MIRMNMNIDKNLETKTNKQTKNRFNQHANAAKWT